MLLLSVSSQYQHLLHVHEQGFNEQGSISINSLCTSSNLKRIHTSSLKNDETSSLPLEKNISLIIYTRSKVFWQIQWESLPIFVKQWSESSYELSRQSEESWERHIFEHKTEEKIDLYLHYFLFHDNKKFKRKKHRTKNDGIACPSFFLIEVMSLLIILDK